MLLEMRLLLYLSCFNNLNISFNYIMPSVCMLYLILNENQTSPYFGSAQVIKHTVELSSKNPRCQVKWPGKQIPSSPAEGLRYICLYFGYL